ncbi:orotidine-5'-phosphate decarboxylase [Pelagibacteraceae bacterium]|nr:orotidine-5'-phosphate decarboxylase [Pelagibacteraceae bacterium]
MKKIFVALDTNSLFKAKKIINLCKTSELKIGFKIGLQLFFLKGGRKFVSEVAKKYPVFLDLKISDISNTSKSAIKSLKDIKFDYITAHVNSGYKSLVAIKKESKKVNKNLKVLGVTVLTSLEQKSLQEIGYTKPVQKIVIKQAKLAKKAELDGIICSGHETKLVKKILKRMDIIVPGIRLDNDYNQDQKRVMTPKKAFENGATAIVIGRSITSGNIKKNIQKLINSLK